MLKQDFFILISTSQWLAKVTLDSITDALSLLTISRSKFGRVVSFQPINGWSHNENKLCIMPLYWYNIRRITKNVQKHWYMPLFLGPVHTHPFSFQTQLCFYGYDFRPHVSDDNNQCKRNFSNTRSSLELFGNAVFAHTCGQTKTELFENAEDTLSVPIHSAQY